MISSAQVEVTEKLSVGLGHNAGSANIKPPGDLARKFFERELSLIAQGLGQSVHLGSLQNMPRS